MSMTAVEALDVIINDDGKLYTAQSKAEARERLTLLRNQLQSAADALNPQAEERSLTITLGKPQPIQVPAHRKRRGDQ